LDLPAPVSSRIYSSERASVRLTVKTWLRGERERERERRERRRRGVVG
jgi:hypothetical protein